MDNLKKLRTEHKLSQQKLADEFRLSQQSIYKYENGLAQPDIQTLKNFASFFHTSIDYLVGYASDKELDKHDIVQKLTSEECLLLDHFRSLSPAMREHILAIMNQLDKVN